VTLDLPPEMPAWLRQRTDAYARHPLVRRPVLRSRFARFAGVQPGHRVLDVGTGPGYNAFAFARRGARVEAIDWRREFVPLAGREVIRRRLRTVQVIEADPVALPFPGRSFDIVTCAAVLHHLPSPLPALQEMDRVCRIGGHLAIEEVVASEQPVRARYHNRMERLRDRSHQRLLSLSELTGALAAAGLTVRRIEVQDSVREFNEWVGVTRPPVRRSEHIRRLLQGSVEQDLSGLAVWAEDDTFLFVQQVAWILAERRD